VAAFAVILAACTSGGATTAPSTAPTEAPATAPGESPSAGASSSVLDRALAGEFTGKAVTALGPFTDEDTVKFEAMVKVFEDATGIDVQYEGTKEFEATIGARVDGGTAPDVVDFPQPGLLANFAKAGEITDLSSVLDMAALQANYNQSWLDMATMPGASGDILAGVWERVNGKSLVWYPKKAFDAAGYTVPTTWDELIALQDKIKEDGDTPWCIGIESGAATGWPATDWIEDLMLRTTTPENYDKWVKGELKFNSPEVKKAVQTMADIWLDDANVNGGVKSIVTTYFGDAPVPMFSDPPKCWLHRQGNFITSFFGEGPVAGTDYDFFYLPPIGTELGKPVLVAGDIWAAFTDKPEALALLQWFTKGEHLKPWMEAGGAIAPHKDADLSWYGSDIERKVGQIIQDATVLRFDASDVMPGQVGTGSFWKEITSFISGSQDLDTTLSNIDATWPQ
jgi:alpha-glucoside transport system substrate-binding protein